MCIRDRAYPYHDQMSERFVGEFLEEKDVYKRQVLLSTQKSLPKGKLHYPPSAKEPLGGVAERGLRGT